MAKVLLVDDDESIISVFQTALEKDGFQVAVSHLGKEGLDQAKSERPDVILLDQILPDMSGNEILKTLKTDPETKAIPVAILSNFGQNELIQEAMNSGAVEYILKYQIAPQDLINKINEILKQPTILAA
ncbi:response regulator [Candidatus Microgenomates bacterium]|nr:MAG: response regulator [Candidatus Microgenomates bacterium]